MKILDADLPGCKIIEPQVFGDSRGAFYESWNKPKWAQAGLDLDFVQSNVSISGRGVLRGLHYQWPQPQGKLVSVLEGEVYDVAVDIRRGSPQFGRWTAVILSAENKREFWIPEGFAHGFVVLSERAVFHYLCTAPYLREADAGIRWDDARLAIDWPVSAPDLSDKDERAPFFDAISPDRLPEYRA
ncbi:MAG TPA: dTDP-4-dehydrorhamnose 3,5-epimerase [Arenimonas sp.]|uniref:dTDP-4-dehydrorhamnose 3,5-epimerase n=1 Tax=Arenimonas sp. TaxID=1872635 RepID=UPI002B532D09|nr:dTDP-4-dehydrorhamnose 3,5-epimerase [Arenimonas sp.]HMB56594.1 dTDP-4-dehydrorhamnose 3,5-epimerase [Arenimonas sp.]